MKTKVSILMTCFNAEAFIEKSIKSIKNQSFKNWELIIVDDFSKDQTLKIAKKLKTNKIKIYSLKKHIGRTKALNYGLKKIKNDLIAILDADDIAYKNRIMVQKNFLEKNQKTLLVGSWYKVIDKSGKIIKNVKIDTIEKNIYKNMIYRNLFCHSSIMFKKSLLTKIGYYPENIIYAQDYAFILKSMKLEIPRVIPKYLTLSRRWDNSMTYNPSYQKDIVLDKIKIMIFSIKNFSYPLLSLFMWSLKFIKAFCDIILLNLKKSKNNN
tara:strand:+ start:668 stop:1468 length:801 start_codon:yes stop_codon:yes gene_type:complete